MQLLSAHARGGLSGVMHAISCQLTDAQLGAYASPRALHGVASWLLEAYGPAAEIHVHCWWWHTVAAAGSGWHKENMQGNKAQSTPLLQ